MASTACGAKSNMYEASSRVPLQIVWPGHIPGGLRVAQNVSLVDLVATIIEAAGASMDIAPLDGDSLLPLINGETETWKDEAFCEYLAHGVIHPVGMLKKGDYKLNMSPGDPLELFNIAEDPNEFNDLSESSTTPRNTRCHARAAIGNLGRSRRD